MNKYTEYARCFGWSGMPLYVVDGKVYQNPRMRGKGQDWFQFMDNLRNNHALLSNQGNAKGF